MNYNEICIIYTNRKTISIEVRHDLSITVRAPLRMKKKDVYRFIDEKSQWIDKHIGIMRQRASEEVLQNTEPKLTPEEIQALAERAAEMIPKRVSHFAPIAGVNYGRITIRKQVSRWGSCSSKGNLNFNCLLILCPSEVLDYIVVHELCHRKQMNHSPQFWNEVKRIMPDYKAQEKWLKENGNKIIRRLP